MSARGKPPTDEQRTAVFEPSRLTDAERRRVVEITTPTAIDHPPSAPMRAISMKAANEPAADRRQREAKEHVVRIRAISEVSRHDTPTNLGRLAPPRDPIGARKRKLRDFVIWGSAVLLVAVGVMLGVWFLAR